MNKYLIILLFLGLNCTTNQENKNHYYESRALISTKNEFLYVKFNNSFEVIAQQENPISFEKISAFQLDGSKRKPIEILPRARGYVINPDTIGLIEINVDLDDKIETKLIRAIPLEAVGRLGKHTANSDNKIGILEFNSHNGIIASIECCNIKGKCKLIDYEIIRISINNSIERILNKGERFEEKSKKLLSKAQSNDIYIFRKLNYRCPGSNRLQRLNDMIFEIK